MSSVRRFLPSPAMLVACIALVVALGGVSYAAAVLPRNSVGTAQLKKTAVSGTKLKTNAVTSKKVRDGSLLAQDFRAGQLPRGASGPSGAQGPQGVQGPPGPTFAAFNSSATQLPPTTPDDFNSQITADVNTPARGRLLVQLSLDSLQVQCFGGQPTVGIYVDGIPVPGTKQELTTATLEDVTVAGLSGPVAAGVHHLRLGMDCPDGNLGLASSDETFSFGATLIAP